MHTHGKLVEELEGHAIHVSHGEHGDDGHASLKIEHLIAKLHIIGHCTIGNHHTLGEARRATGVVDDGQVILVMIVVVVDHVLLETVGELLSKELIEMLASIGQALVAADAKVIVLQANDTQHIGNLVLIEVFPVVLTDEG